MGKQPILMADSPGAQSEPRDDNRDRAKQQSRVEIGPLGTAAFYADITPGDKLEEQIRPLGFSICGAGFSTHRRNSFRQYYDIEQTAGQTSPRKSPGLALFISFLKQVSAAGGRRPKRTSELIPLCHPLRTVYDMCKAVDKGMIISDIHLQEKHSGKSGDFTFEGQNHG